MRFKLLILFSIFAFCISACTTDEVVSVYGDVYGTITDAKTGNPVYNAEVILSPGNMTTVSGSNGHYEFKSLDAGQYKIGIEADGYEYNSRQVTIVPGENVVCDFILTPVPQVQKLKIEPSSLDFGTTQTEMAVIITNEGTVETDWSINFGNNNWVSAAPKAGRISSGKTQSIVFAVNRDLLPEQKSIIVNLAAFGNSYPISVSCSPKQTKGELVLESSSIDFGEDSSEKTLKLKNIGDGSLIWTISNISAECLAVSDTTGAIEPGGSKVVKIILDRTKLALDLTTSFVVSDGTKDQTVNVAAKKKVSIAEMKVSVDVIDFGEEATLKSFVINNIGTADLNWNISNNTESCLEFSSTSGIVHPNESVSVNIILDRQIMPQNLNITINVTDGTKAHPINIKGVKVTVEDYTSATITSCDNRITAEIISCKRNVNTVTLTYRLTNIGVGTINDWRIYTPNSMSLIMGGYRSVVYDDLGNEYGYPVFTFRTATASGSNWIGTTFPAEVPCTGTVKITDVPANATKMNVMLGVFAYPLSSYNLADNRIWFKNVPIY